MMTFLGTGLLGANFVQAALERGEQVRVWNRSPAKAEALRALGAVVCADPADAARGAERVHLALSDDAAVDEVLERAAEGFQQGVMIVDHTTTSPRGARARVERWRQREFAFVHAPVFMGPQNAREATGLMLVSGDPALVEQVTPLLAPMTGKVLNLGPDPERAASFKLLGNLFLMFITAGLTDMFTLAKAVGVTAADAAELLKSFNPGANLEPRIQRMLGEAFGTPSWELAMARKDARLMQEAAELGGHPLAVLPAIAASMDRFLARGHAHDDWTVIAKDVVGCASGASFEGPQCGMAYSCATLVVTPA
jgi:3-hydroxyisobutyrate dehydrogenase